MAADDDGDHVGFAGRRYSSRLLQIAQLRRRVRRLPRVSRAAAAERPIAARARMARSTSTSTIARPTTASCCSTRSSAATRSSTRSSGATTTGPSPAAGGRPSTTRSSSTCARLARTSTTPTRSSASRIWPQGWSRAEKAARGKRPTDVWFHTIVPTNGREKTGYPTQKPEGVLRRIVSASSRPGGWCLDPFAGSGTLGAVCRQLGRRFVLIDENPVAIEVMTNRLAAASDREPAARSRTARAAGA